MQNVYISINPFEKKMNVLFSSNEADLSSVSIYPLSLPRGCHFGACDYEQVFSESFTDLLRINNIPEANITVALPSGDVCFDFVTIPNVGSSRRNDENFFTEIKTMYPDVKKPEELNATLIKSDKSQCVYRYSMLGRKNYDKIKDFFVNTNHSLDFITSNIVASAYLVMTFANTSKGLFSKDNAYEFAYIKKKHTEIALISDGQICAVNVIPVGTDALRKFGAKDITDYRSFADMDSAFSSFWHNYNLYRLHVMELGLPVAKKCQFLAPRNYSALGEYLSAGSDLNWTPLDLPEQYKNFADNLELVGLYLGKVPPEFNFAPSEKTKSILSK